MTQVPSLPFEGYKWRWAEFLPVENLNHPPTFLGVLRAMRECEGQAASSANFQAALAKIEAETKPPSATLHLASAATERNLLRRSGRYWKALSVLEDTRPGIQLTSVGRDVADRKITQDQFAAWLISNLELPNVRIEDDEVIRTWREAGLTIRPLHLILEILAVLRETQAAEAYLRPLDLERVVVALAGVRAPVADIAAAVLAFRRNPQEFGAWPNVTPKDNDPRMLREFLLFLANYGYLELVSAGTRRDEQYWLPDSLDIRPALTLDAGPRDLDVLQGAANEVARSRVLREVLERPGQAKFRQDLLDQDGACMLTGERIPAVLQAAHARPVASGGSDAPGNGILLRSDLHALWDAKLLRINAEGEVFLSPLVASSASYASLPRRVTVPDAKRAMLRWRWDYL